MSEERKPWMTPVIYNDDRFSAADTGGDSGDERTAEEVEERINRGGARPSTVNKSTDTEPMDYNRGPHEEEFGVDDDGHDDIDELHRAAFEKANPNPLDEGSDMEDWEDRDENEDDDDSE